MSLVSCGLSCSSDLRAGVAAGLTFPHLSRPNPQQSYKLDNGQHKPTNEYSEYNPQPRGQAVFQPLSVKPHCASRCVYLHHSNPKMQHHCSTARSSSAGFYKQHHLRISETSALPELFPNSSSTTALSFQSKMESLQSWMHSPPRAQASLTSHKASHPELLWHNTSCCCWITATHPRPRPASTEPSKGRHRGSRMVALQLKSFLGPLTSICSRFGSSSWHQSLQQAATLSSAASTASVSFTKRTQFQGGAGLQSHTPYQQDGKYSGTLQPYQMWGFWVRLACVG